MEYAGRFNQKSYEENDLLGKQLLLAYLYKRGHTILPQTFQEDYGVDIHTELEGKEYWFEVEMKDGYTFTDGRTFPYPTVSFLGRKSKWKGKKFYYCIISKTNYAAIISHSTLIYQPEYRTRIEINTTRRSGYDTFYRVPKKYCSFKSPEEFYNKDYAEVWNQLIK
jgi:hypothetical protein